MRDDQHLRRLAYIVLGAVPAAVLTILALWMADPATDVGALTGTVGLCAATLARLPPDSPNVRMPIAAALIIGLVTIAFWASLFLYWVVSDLGRGDADGQATRSFLTVLGRALLSCWLLVGPMAIALHFLLSLRRSRTPNTGDQSAT